MAGAFDDLIPQSAQASAPQKGAFDDLVPAQPHGFWPIVKDQAGKAAQAADDIVRLTANGMTLGYADKLAAFGNGDSVDQERSLSKAAQDRSGSAGTVAGIAGAMTPAGIAGKVVGGVGAAAEGVPLLGRLLGSKLTQAGLSGAAVGAGDASGNDQSIGQGAAIGAGAGLLGQTVASGLSGAVSKAAGMFNAKPVIPSGADLKQAARNAYAASENAGVIVHPDAVQRLGDTIKGGMADFGYSPFMQPRGQAVLSALDGMQGQNVTLKGLDTLRQVTGRMREGGGSEAALGQRIMGHIDDFANNLAPSDIVTGDGATAVEALKTGRSLWMRSAKSDALDNALESARLRAGSTGTGGNIDNATRQNVRGLLGSQGNWTPDERQAMESVITGTPGQNILRQAGRLSPEGNGLMAALNIGATMANPIAGAVGLGGFAAKRIADATTGANVDRLSSLIRAGGDATSLLPVPNAVQRLAQSKRDALGRVLSSYGILSAMGARAQ